MPESGVNEGKSDDGRDFGALLVEIGVLASLTLEEESLARV